MLVEEEMKIIDLLNGATEDDLPQLKARIPTFLNCESELVCAEAVEFVGNFELIEFLPLVRSLIIHFSPIVRQYTLSALYDLEGDAALEEISKHYTDQSKGVTIQALALGYIIGEDESLLLKIHQSIKEDEWNHILCSIAAQTFDYYLYLENFEEVVRLLSEMLTNMDHNCGTHKDILQMLQAYGIKHV